jgi:hypothetical protein
MQFNVNEINNMQKAIANYKAKLEEPRSKLSQRIEYADNFKGSSIAEVIKGYLETMVHELDRVYTYVEGLDHDLVFKEEEPVSNVEVELTPAAVPDGFQE